LFLDLEAAAVPIIWEIQHVTPETGVSDEVIASMKKNKIGLKGSYNTLNFVSEFVFFSSFEQ
jgi:hypothetical protein